MDNITLHFALASRIQNHFGGQPAVAWELAGEMLATPPATLDDARALFLSVNDHTVDERHDELGRVSL